MNNIIVEREAGPLSIRGHRPLLAGRAAAFWSAITGSLATSDNPSRLLRLNDHLLRDIGRSRTDLECQAMYWPFRAPRPKDSV